MVKSRYDGIYTRTKANGEKVFFARWKGKHGKQHNKKLGSAWGGMSLQGAVKLRARLVLDENLGEFSPNYVKVEKTKYTVDQCAELYYKSKHWDWESTAYKTYISPYIGHIKVDELKLEVMLNWWKTLQTISNSRTGKEFAPKTKNDRADELYRIFKYAIRVWELDVKNLASRDFIPRNKVNNSRDRYLTEDEVKKLKESIMASNRKDKDLLILFVDLALSLGARVSTLVRIKIKDIDLETSRIKLHNQKVGDRVYIGFVHPQVKDRLSEIMERCEPEQYLFSETYWPRTTNFFRQRLQLYFDKLFNTSDTERKQKVVLHTLRHTTASRLAISGVAIHKIQKILDHSSVMMTMKYAHLSPSSGQDDINQMVL